MYRRIVMFVVVVVDQPVAASLSSPAHKAVWSSVVIITWSTARIPTVKLFWWLFGGLLQTGFVVILVCCTTRRFIAANTLWLLPPDTILRHPYSHSHIPVPNSSKRLPGVPGHRCSSLIADVIFEISSVHSCAGTFGDRTPMAARISVPVQTGRRSHPGYPWRR
jgi:hypothetical protein